MLASFTWTCILFSLFSLFRILHTSFFIVATKLWCFMGIMSNMLEIWFQCSVLRISTRVPFFLWMDPLLKIWVILLHSACFCYLQIWPCFFSHMYLMLLRHSFIFISEVPVFIVHNIWPAICSNINVLKIRDLIYFFYHPKLTNYLHSIYHNCMSFVCTEIQNLFFIH